MFGDLKLEGFGGGFFDWLWPSKKLKDSFLYLVT
jgi:hypothetical protein